MAFWAVAARLLCPLDSPGKNTSAGGRALPQGVFPTQGPRPRRLHLPEPASGFFTTSAPRSPLVPPAAVKAGSALTSPRSPRPRIPAQLLLKALRHAPARGPLRLPLPLEPPPPTAARLHPPHSRLSTQTAPSPGLFLSPGGVKIGSFLKCSPESQPHPLLYLLPSH